MYPKIRSQHLFSLKPILFVTLLTTMFLAPVLLGAEGEVNAPNITIPDPEACWQDFDLDGFGHPDFTESCDTGANNNEDCDDGDFFINPDATEIWYDGIDQDCDGWNDYDQDSDTYISSQYPGNAGGTALNEGDCDDVLFTINPGVAEIPNDGVDQNCTGNDAVTCILDVDRDGFGTDDGTIVIAEDGICDASQGESANALDCNDGDASTNPNANDIPDDTIDQNCNGVDTKTCYADGDGDGFAGSTTVLANDGSCDAGEDEYEHPLDCNDSDKSTWPGANEIWYDGVDQDCDGANDYDQDKDSYIASQFGDNGGGTAPNTGDCDDLNFDIHPGAIDIPGNEIDEDCDGADQTLEIFNDGFEEDP